MTEDEIQRVISMNKEKKVTQLREFKGEIEEVIKDINSDNSNFYEVYLEKASYIVEFISYAFAVGDIEYPRNGKYSIKARRCIYEKSGAQKSFLISALEKLSRICEECAQEIEKYGDGSPLFY